jgi:hypothetical protein
MSDSRHKNSNLHRDRVNSPGPILLPEPDEPTCTTCNGQFASIERFLDHYEACKNGDILYCRKCKSRFKDEDHVNAHLSKCIQRKSQCQCGQWYRAASDLTIHRKICNPGLTLQEKREELGEECPRCHEKFLKLHEHMNIGACTPIELKQNCPRCGEAYCTRSLYYHLRNDNCNKENTYTSCQICRKQLKKSSVLGHIAQIHGGPFFGCTIPLCKRNLSGFVFSRKSMETHMNLDSHVNLAEKYPPRNLELPSLYHNISIRAQLTTFLASNMGGIPIEKDVDQSSMEKRSAASHLEDDDEESEIGDNESGLTLESLLQQSKSARRPIAISETMRNTTKFGNAEILLRSKLPYSCL